MTKGQKHMKDDNDVSPNQKRFKSVDASSTPPPPSQFSTTLKLQGINPGTITKITNFGAFVQLQPSNKSLKGMVHVSQTSKKKFKFQHSRSCIQKSKGVHKSVECANG
mmetsp:Transcript_18860/g.27629  ORF Transcript_18860/g.27629 Transcript_18860/m.27629 type:complete len:108 (-) Transcript_18860:239-562(-)